MWERKLKLLLGVCSLPLESLLVGCCSHHLQSCIDLKCPFPSCMCRLYVSFVLVTEVHCGAETFMGQGEMELSVLQCERAPSPPTTASPHFGGRFPKNQSGLSASGIETLLETLAEGQPSTPKAAGVLHSPAKLSGPGPWAAQSDGLLSASPSELSPVSDVCKDLTLPRPQCCSRNAELIA